MVSFSQMREFLETNAGLSAAGRDLIQSGLMSEKAFCLAPANITRGTYEQLKLYKEVILIPPSDIEALGVSKEARQRKEELKRDYPGCDIVMMMSCYPDDVYDQLPSVNNPIHAAKSGPAKAQGFGPKERIN